MWKSQASDFCYLFLFFWNGNWLFIGVQYPWISRCLNLETGGLQPVCLATKSTKPNSYSSIHSGYISVVQTQMSLGPRPNRVGINGPRWIAIPKLCFPVFFLNYKTSSALNFERLSESFQESWDISNSFPPIGTCTYYFHPCDSSRDELTLNLFHLPLLLRHPHMSQMKKQPVRLWIFQSHLL